MYGLIPDKVLNICLHNPMYERDKFKMWGRILEKYDSRDKETLFESVSELYVLVKIPTDSLSNYMSCACHLFSGLKG